MNHATRVMKTKAKKKILTFGDLIAAAYGACGKGQAEGILRLVVDARLIEFTGEQRIVISNSRG